MKLRLIRRFPTARLGFLVMLCSAIAGVIRPGLPLVSVSAETMKPAIVKPTIVKPVIQAQPIPNPLIDYDQFAAQVKVVGKLRAKRRITETEFLRLAAKPGTVVLDARSTERYRDLHIQGATNLSFPDITVEALARIIPTKTSLILIYCNNNFLNAPIAFASKAPSASLNINTYNTLHSYGYKNIYELGPLLDVKTTKLSLVGDKK